MPSLQIHLQMSRQMLLTFHDLQVFYWTCAKLVTCCYHSRSSADSGFVCLQLLRGRMPDMGQAVASKASGVALSNTSLVQCTKTHLAAFFDDDVNSSTQVHARLQMKSSRGQPST